MAKTTAKMGTMANRVEYVRADAFCNTRLAVKKRTASTIFFSTSKNRNFSGETSPSVILHKSV